ncbi:DUF1499 domain-containing protein [Candidatus Binatus sp.]|jgi:hypothetical protein|uniref:DUF1499 domain-containing protein n=1 Tax=Candidatus Binatus sp. TaxID=2811406 RepID=UPI003BE74E52
MITPPVIVVAFLAIAVIAVMTLVPFMRLVLGRIVRLAFFLIPVAVAAAGIAMIMNDETIFERPGPQQRVVRFVTMNSAAASPSGYGSVICEVGNLPQAATPAESAPKKRAAEEALANQREPRRRLEPVATPAPLDDVYPELLRRGYPGISRQKLFQLSQDTINSLGGWKIVKADPRNSTIDCIYTTRIFKFEDDVRITVQASGEIDVCSRSGLARPAATSLLRYFPGDLGASVGHIKEFYEALEPKMDEVYKEEQDRQNAKKPH